MRTKVMAVYVGLAFCLAAQGQTAPAPRVSTVETLVCFRHGEKPAGGLGQLSCQGFNRALALPRVLLAKYAAPQFAFAPDPAEGITEYAGTYNYVRPLATIEPTAIYCGIPVNTQFGFTQITNLEVELQKDIYQNATVYISWEHVFLVFFAQDMVRAYGGDPAQVPAWPEYDYDSIYLIKILRGPSGVSVTFSMDQEGLNSVGGGCALAQAIPAKPGIRANQFGFNLSGAPDSLVVVEASPSLAGPVWAPVGTNLLSGGSGYFNDPRWTNYSSRYYRLSHP
jgi:hypothetical protein